MSDCIDARVVNTKWRMRCVYLHLSVIIIKWWSTQYLQGVQLLMLYFLREKKLQKLGSGNLHRFKDTAKKDSCCWNCMAGDFPKLPTGFHLWQKWQRQLQPMSCFRSLYAFGNIFRNSYTAWLTVLVKFDQSSHPQFTPRRETLVKQGEAGASETGREINTKK